MGVILNTLQTAFRISTQIWARWLRATVYRRFAVSITVALCCAMVAVALTTASIWANTEAPSPPDNQPDNVVADYDPESMLIGLSPEMGLDALEALLADHALELVRHWPDLNIAHVRLRDDIVLAADVDLEAFAAQNRSALANAAPFRFVEFDGIVQIAGSLEAPPDLEPAPNDPLVASQYALDTIRAREAWNITHGNPEIAVAVIDTGYASQHEDIAFENVWRNAAEYNGLPNIDDDANGYIDDIHGWNWFDNNNNPEDENGHGTHIFGTIAANTNNDVGMAGLGRSIRVAPLRIFGPAGTGRISDLIEAIDYAVQQQIPILNLSLTTPSDSPALREAVDRAAGEGMLVVAASGNMAVGASFTAVQYPAVYASTLAVAATTADDEWARFSRYGQSVDVAAPGDNILSAYINDEYRSISGTSMATAHVSALAGLIMSLRPDMDAQDVRNLIMTTAVDVNADEHPGKDQYLGAGRIDMAAALLEASKALTVTTDGIGLTSDGELRAQVTAPPAGNGQSQARLPVVNAMLHYRIHPAEDGPATEWQRLPTNADGYVYIPMLPEDSIIEVDLQVGAVARTVQVTTLPEGTRLTLALEAESVTVGSSPISYTIALRDGDDNLVNIAGTVEISSDLGSLDNDANEMIAFLVEGEYTGLWTPGTSSGQAHIRARVGANTSTPLTATASVNVLPDKPFKIVGPTQLFPEVSISANSVLLQFHVADQFDNPVEDGTDLTLFASDGTLATASLQTINGKASTTIKLPIPQTQTISVWVVVPAGPLEIRVDIPPKRVRIWFPALQADIPLAQQ